MAFVRGEDRQQCTLFPVSLDELVGPDHVCRVILGFASSLDLVELGFERACPGGTGRPPYDPADLLMLYLYGYLHRIRSSRRLEQECHRNVEVMWLLNRLRPDHKTIAEFRRRNGVGLRSAGAAFIRFCVGVGLVRGDWVAIDGSKFQAVASGKAIQDAAELAERDRQLQQRIAQYLQELEAADAEGQEREFDRQALRSALDALLERRLEIKQAAHALQREGRKRRVATEPEAVVLKGRGPGYNVQTAVDAEHAIVIAHQVTAQAGDNSCLQTMANAAQHALGRTEFNVVADAGYSNAEQAQGLEDAGITPHVPATRTVNSHGGGTFFNRSSFTYDAGQDAFVCPAGKQLPRKNINRPEKAVIYAARDEDCAGCAFKPTCTHAKRRIVSRHLFEDALDRMHARATPIAMRLRRCTVEHPFAALKYNIFEKPRFLLRGLSGAGTEMALATLVYNLKRATNVLGRRRMIALLASGMKG